MMNLITWIIFGTATGVIIHYLDPRPDEGGIIGSIVLGLLGSVLGGLLGNLILGISVRGFSFTSFAVALLGSMLLIFTHRFLRHT